MEPRFKQYHVSATVPVFGYKEGVNGPVFIEDVPSKLYLNVPIDRDDAFVELVDEALDVDVMTLSRSELIGLVGASVTALLDTAGSRQEALRMASCLEELVIDSVAKHFRRGPQPGTSTDEESKP